jgi:hypothetical protein
MSILNIEVKDMAKKGRPRGGKNHPVVRQYWRKASNKYYRKKKAKR